MDVEGAEWPILESLADMGEKLGVDQLMFEIHFFANGRPSQHHLQTHDQTHQWYRILRKISQVYDIFFVHANPMSSTEQIPNPVHCCYELSLLIRTKT